MNEDLRSQIFGKCVASANSPAGGVYNGILGFFDLGIRPDQVCNKKVKVDEESWSLEFLGMDMTMNALIRTLRMKPIALFIMFRLEG